MEFTPLTKKQAEDANWPCVMCKYNLGVRTPEIKVCYGGHCQAVSRRIKRKKPLNFTLEEGVLIPSSPPGSVGHTIKKPD